MTDASVGAAPGGRRLEGLDVLVQGEGVRRGVSVEVTADAVRAGGLSLPVREIYWTSRRAGLLMLFARDLTVAVKGGRAALDELGRIVEEQRGGRSGRGRLPASVSGEVVVCTAGTAVVGRVAGHAASGLRVAVVTRRAVHLLSRDRDLRLGWPVDAAEVEDEPEGRPRGRALVLRKGRDLLRLLYLFPEEMEAVLRVAGSAPPGPAVEDGLVRLELPDPPEAGGDGGAGEGPGRPGEPSPAPPETATGAPEEPAVGPGEDPAARDDGGDVQPGRGPDPGGGASAREPVPGADGDDGPEAGALELFARREVAGPVQPELPTFRVSVDTLQEGAREAARELSEEAVRRAGLGAHFLETHFLELGETALGPLLLRKSAASTARSLERALEAMDASELKEDTDAAAANAADRLIEVYRRELTRLLSEKRAAARVEEEHGLGVEEREDIRLRVHAPFEKLMPRFRELEERQHELSDRLEVLEEGPPGGGEEELDEASEAWRRALARVDVGFASAWEELVGEIVDVWETRLLPSLAEVGAMQRRRVPEWMYLTVLALVTLLAAAAVMILWVW